MAKYAVVLLNLGGPDSLEAVEPFLKNLFSDPDIFNIPIGQEIFAKFISRRRAPKVRERYRAIGGKSPINEWTRTQAEMLAEALKKEVAAAEVYVAMRYWEPAIRKVAAKLSSGGFEKIVLLPLYPHYSFTTTKSSFREWRRAYTGDPSRLIYVDHFSTHPIYVRAVNRRIDEALSGVAPDVRNRVHLVFSAHGIPEKLVKQGDPYSGQVQQTVHEVMTARGFSHVHHLCFQSRVGPMKWLKPSTADTLLELARKNVKDVLVVPISFVSDHIETLHELAIEYRAVAMEAGIETYVVMQGLNDSHVFVDALKEIVINALDAGPANHQKENP